MWVLLVRDEGCVDCFFIWDFVLSSFHAELGSASLTVNLIKI